MYERLLTFLRCPGCRASFALTPLARDADEITEALLRCASGHWFPVVRGIPRMLPDSLDEHWPAIERSLPNPVPDAIRALVARRGPASTYDRRTRLNFSHEWDHHDLGGKTWSMDLDDRVEWFFVHPLRIPVDELDGTVVLDAGCGNGSQSVAYTRYGAEVVAVDVSSGLEHGYALRRRCPGAVPEKVHFVQGDLQRPPLAPASVDIVHSAGVLHHTPNTLATFRALRPLLRPGGTFYVWLYKYERVVTPLVNALRIVTTRVPSVMFARFASVLAVVFQAFCRTVNALGVRAYPPLSRREAALALMDIFGAPYAHYHSFDEVRGWYVEAGFGDVWGCNDGRRGFGVCGRLGVVEPSHAPRGEGRGANGRRPQERS